MTSQVVYFRDLLHSSNSKKPVVWHKRVVEDLLGYVNDGSSRQKQAKIEQNENIKD